MHLFLYAFNLPALIKSLYKSPQQPQLASSSLCARFGAGLEREGHLQGRISITKKIYIPLSITKFTAVC